MRTTKAVNTEVRELLGHVREDSLTNNAMGCFTHVNCFAVSSLGKKPAVEQTVDPKTNETIETGHLDGPPEPFRVKDPFYWILMKNGLLNKFENNQYTSTGKETLRPIYKRKWWKRLLGLS
jgi:hypothetical protein